MSVKKGEENRFNQRPVISWFLYLLSAGLRFAEKT
jgi:hypothetical protein